MICDILEFARHLPECRIFGTHMPDQAGLDKIAACANVRLDLAGMQGGLHLGALASAVKTAGVDRMLFGTDFDGYAPRAFIEAGMDV